ncbi:hypothetical protein M0804_015160 [Polistes exclamans]|nr:hypothetical protein M0804_015160 [Polistes exclamans]
MIIDTGQRVEPAVSTRKTLVFGIQGSLGMSYQNCMWHYKAYESSGSVFERDGAQLPHMGHSVRDTDPW